jgi:RNA 2',3'-cyclic 3'-phosphodiesterase
MTSGPTRRLFFALWPDERMQAALAEATRSTLSGGGGRAIPAGNFHLTLAFLGSVPESKIPSLSPIAAKVAAEFAARGEPIAVTLDTVEYWRKSGVLCATCSAPSSAAAVLAQALQAALIAGRVAPDLEPLEPVGNWTVIKFLPHVTLARKAERPIPQTTTAPVTWRFGEFALVQSRIEQTGAAYTVLESYSLG